MTSGKERGSKLLQSVLMLIALLAPAGVEGVASAATTDATEPPVARVVMANATTRTSQAELASLQMAMVELDRAKRLCAAAGEGLVSAPAKYFDALELQLESFARTKDLSALVTGLRRAWLEAEFESGQHHAGPLDRLRRRWTNLELRDEQLLERTFAQTPELLELTEEALVAASAAIGVRRMSLALEPLVDPEDPVEVVRIYLVFVTSEDVRAGSQVLDDFDEQWFLANCSRAGGRLSVSTDYL